VRTAGSLVLTLLLVTTSRDVDRVTALDLELPLPGLVLTTLLELEEELRGVVTTALDFAEELLDEDETDVLGRLACEVLLTAFFTAGVLFLELLLRTEVVLDLLLFDPDLRCASAPMGAASMAIKIMMTNFFMISGFYLLIQLLQSYPCKYFAKVRKPLYNDAFEVVSELVY
jgi:hypothetical protein